MNLSSNGTDYDLSIISNLTNLKLLYIGNNPLTDISPLKNLTNLYCLDISFTNLIDFSPLKDLPNLKTLFASGYDFNEYDYLVNLSHNKISDISPLAALNATINNNYLSIDITDQDITLDDCSSEDNFNLPLSIKDLNGNLITNIYNVSNGGVYNSTDNKITWNKDQAGSNVYYQFQYSYKSLKFSGTSSTNLVKTYSPDYYMKSDLSSLKSLIAICIFLNNMFIIKYIVNYNLLLTITKSLRIYDPPKTFFIYIQFKKNNCTPPLFQDTFLITFYSSIYLI